VAVLKPGSAATDAEHAKQTAAACNALAEIVAPTLGPGGLDLLLATKRDPMVTNDGASILNTLKLTHPAARVLAAMSQSQDAMAGDGTTSVVLLASAVIARLAELQNTTRAGHAIGATLRLCQLECEAAVADNAIDISKSLDEYIVKCAETALYSKILSAHASLFAQIALRVVKTLGPDGSLGLVGIQAQKGGSTAESELIEGFAIPKCFAYAGAKSQPMAFDAPRVALLNIELEHKAERVNAEVRINSVAEYERVVAAEWTLLFDKLEKIASSGARVVLSSLPVGDVAYQFFSDRGIYCGGRVPKEEMTRAALALGGRVSVSLDDAALKANLGACQRFEERQIGGERYAVFRGGPASKSCTLIVRGAGEFAIGETKRALHDALKVAMRIANSPSVVVGGGAIEMAISARLRKFATEKLTGKRAVYAEAIADAFETIPSRLAKNLGLDATATVAELRQKHRCANNENSNSRGAHFGVALDASDPQTGATLIVADCRFSVLEPEALTRHKLFAVFESARLLLAADRTVRAPRHQAVSQDLLRAKNALQDQA